MTFRHPTLAAALIFTFIALIPAAAESSIDDFTANTPGSALSVDHSEWGNLLEKYLTFSNSSGINRFDYAAVSTADLNSLDSYLTMLQKTDVGGMDKDEQMAFWINLYNALTVKVILDKFPVNSIKDISLPGSRGGPWKAPLVTVAGVNLSLNDIEHGILRPIWKDKRIHYAVNCASLGCPNLAPKPYIGETLDTMLDNAASDYINHPRGVDRDGRRLRLSSIYNWYKEDFGDRTELEAHLLQYAGPDTTRKIREASGSIKYGYDWNLNKPD